MKPDQMFLNGLFSIIQIDRVESSNKLSGQIRLNPAHAIFKGHFPGNPILPGVCIVQIIKEILMCHLGNKLILNCAVSIKYLSFINPEKYGLISFNMELAETGNDIIFCDVSLNFESVVLCRFKGDFKVI